MNNTNITCNFNFKIVFGMIISGFRRRLICFLGQEVNKKWKMEKKARTQGKISGLKDVLLIFHCHIDKIFH